MKKPTLVVEDRTKEILDMLKKFQGDKVLVGIPQDDNDRNDSTETIGNATLLFINNFGSPANNIPARPVMEIGIRNAQEQIAAEFEKAVTKGMKQGPSAISKYYERAGMIASNSVKKVINDQVGIEPPSPATLAARSHSGFKGVKALLVTGQMRNAITYVVKG